VESISFDGKSVEFGVKSVGFEGEVVTVFTVDDIVVVKE